LNTQAHIRCVGFGTHVSQILWQFFGHAWRLAGLDDELQAAVVGRWERKRKSTPPHAVPRARAARGLAPGCVL
jgi:hypothetical protein